MRRLLRVLPWVLVIVLLLGATASAAAHTPALEGLIELFRTNLEGFIVYGEML